MKILFSYFVRNELIKKSHKNVHGSKEINHLEWLIGFRCLYFDFFHFLYVWFCHRCSPLRKNPDHYNVEHWFHFNIQTLIDEVLIRWEKGREIERCPDFFRVYIEMMKRICLTFQIRIMLFSASQQVLSEFVIEIGNELLLIMWKKVIFLISNL